MQFYPLSGELILRLETTSALEKKILELKKTEAEALFLVMCDTSMNEL
jgi:hypothetical protein